MKNRSIAFQLSGGFHFDGGQEGAIAPALWSLCRPLPLARGWSARLAAVGGTPAHAEVILGDVFRKLQKCLA